MDRPNVLLISVDHWFGQMIGALGHPTVLTPTLDQIIMSGVAFTNAYAPTPSCIPARREIMTGTHARTHGDRVFNEKLPMPQHLPTLAQTFRANGYQTFAVGKLHVYPPRDRIGFDDILLNEEGRHQFGLRKDDYELYLHDEGYSGQEFGHGMSHNDYLTRPWHLPEKFHPTNWTAYQMSKAIARRDPRKPSFWYMSFNHPHPPLAPLAEYMDIYRDLEIDEPFTGEWAKDRAKLPYAVRARRHSPDLYPDRAVRKARQAFYALATHIDHQIRLVMGTIRELDTTGKDPKAYGTYGIAPGKGTLDNTIIMFTSDHGDMLGNHGMYAKAVMYENSIKVPLLLMPQASRKDIGKNRRDDRLAVQADIFPTLMDLCGIPTPPTVEGLSLVGEKKRDYIYGEHWENAFATRMVRNRRYKLVYYPVGNRFHMFDLQNDPNEMHDISEDSAHAAARKELTELLIENLYGDDLRYVKDGKLVGTPDRIVFRPSMPDGSYGNQRGYRY
ncbi:MAG: DUF4976 domain-containing protein [SAR202 cluster bacterium]|nr:DUF4976 domain-containing protein [SAR202 cluster bacterium]